MNTNRITHGGIVDSVEGGIVKVRLELSGGSAECSSCRLSAVCSSDRRQQVTVSVEAPDSCRSLRRGDHVRLTAKDGATMKAAAYLLVYPLLSFLLIAFIIDRYGGSEPAALFGGLAAAAANYMVCKHFLKRDRSLKWEMDILTGDKTE